MYSVWGVDHGEEISKAVPVKRIYDSAELAKWPNKAAMKARSDKEFTHMQGVFRGTNARRFFAGTKGIDAPGYGQKEGTGFLEGKSRPAVKVWGRDHGPGIDAPGYTSVWGTGHSPKSGKGVSKGLLTPAKNVLGHLKPHPTATFHQPYSGGISLRRKAKVVGDQSRIKAVGSGVPDFLGSGHGAVARNTSTAAPASARAYKPFEAAGNDFHNRTTKLRAAGKY